MSTPSPTGNRIREVHALLARGLEEELLLLQKFIDLLQREQQALTGGDIQLMLSLGDEKSRLATQLSLSAERRSSQLATVGFSSDRFGVESWLDQTQTAQTTAQASLPPVPSAREQWAELLVLAAQARNLNETNGRLIGMHLQHNQQALNTLLSATHQAMLYGPDGQAHAAHSGRLFGSA